MKRSIVLTVILFVSIGIAHAQHPVGEIEDSAWGLRFTPPEGWTQVQAPEGYVFAAPSQQGFLAVLHHQAPTLDALRAEAQQGIADGTGTLLRLQGAITAFGDSGLAADYEGWIEGSPARARAVGLVARHGRGVTILVAIAPGQYSAEHAALAEEVAQSVVFSAPPAQAAPTQPAGTEEQEWQEFFQGCRLSYFNRYDSGYSGADSGFGTGGYIDETVIDMCPGYFRFNDHTETVFNDMNPATGNSPYINNDRRGSGQWSVVRQGGESVLQLHFHDGTVKSYALGYEDGKTFLDGKRWLRTCDPNSSVVEARPQCY